MPASSPPAPAPKKQKSECHSCHRTVVWVLLDKKIQPLDHLPDGGGDVAIEPDLPGMVREGPPRAIFVGTSTHYRRHIVSCPDAEKWRQRWRTTAERPFSRMKEKKTR